MKMPAPENTSMLVGAASAIGASACCVLPFALASVGIGGAWLAHIRALERFFPVFVGIAVVAFAYGFYQTHVKRPVCEAGSACAEPKTQGRQKVIFWSAFAFAIVLIGFPFVYA